MAPFWKAAAAALIAAVLGLSVGKREKDAAVLLTMAVCCMVGVIALNYLQPVLALLKKLETLVDIQGGMMSILLKAVGIATVTEIAGMICNDAGNGSLGKMLQILGTSAILFLSIPVFEALLTLIQEILGEL